MQSFTHPTAKYFAGFLFVWIAGIVLLVLAMTDLFTTPFFQGKYLLVYFLMLSSLIVLIKLAINYSSVKKKQVPL